MKYYNLLRIFLIFNIIFFVYACTETTIKKFDITKSFYLQFGRGSGWHGLDTIEIKETGDVTMIRMKNEWKDKTIYYFWEKTTISLNSLTIKNIALKIESLDLISMKSNYRADIMDGTQWILWIKQGEQKKSIYFDNSFPSAIKDFANFIDNELKKAGIDKAEWVRVPKNEARNHEKDIWNSLK